MAALRQPRSMIEGENIFHSWNSMNFSLFLLTCAVFYTTESSGVATEETGAGSKNPLIKACIVLILYIEVASAERRSLCPSRLSLLVARVFFLNISRLKIDDNVHFCTYSCQR
jgi:hypothetical protein